MSKFTLIDRGDWPAVEVYDGATFISVGIVGIGGGFQIHLTPEQADELGDVLRTISRKQLKKDEVEA
jgi:hypothetical protein